MGFDLALRRLLRRAKSGIQFVDHLVGDGAEVCATQASAVPLTLKKARLAAAQLLARALRFYT